jgi:hypothetical protein
MGQWFMHKRWWCFEEMNSIEVVLVQPNYIVLSRSLGMLHLAYLHLVQSNR